MTDPLGEPTSWRDAAAAHLSLDPGGDGRRLLDGFERIWRTSLAAEIERRGLETAAEVAAMLRTDDSG